MMYELETFDNGTLDAGFIRWLVEEQWPQSSRRFNRLWDYYANCATESLTAAGDTARGYVQAQEVGLPPRITGKADDGMGDKPVAPGRMWHTDNPDATIESFGGDAASPSEDLHIAEVREAMDKVSGVTPVVAGVLKNKLGNLSSAVALKMTFMGMLSKTYRKQLTYGQGIKGICKITLEILDKANIFKTDIDERDVEVIFPNPIEETI